MIAQSFEVIIVGAGPVGLVTAHGLAKNGVSVLIIEKNSVDVPPQWRGSTIHPPTLEIFDEIGLANKIIEGGIRVDLLQYRDLEIDEVVNFKYSTLENKVKFPFRIQYEQYKVLKLLRDGAAHHPNIEIWYETELLDLVQDFDQVHVRVATKDGDKNLDTAFLVAADGSHSQVRKSLGIELEGFTYPFPTTVVATPFNFEKYLPDLAPVTYWSGPTGRLSMIRTPDIWRIAMTTPLLEVDLATSDRGTIESPTDDFKSAVTLLLKRIPGATLADLELKQYEVYRSHQRVAREFSKGRVALAGDAAHLTTTNGGMGLNSGVQDAAALVKSLLTAIKTNSTSPIERYASERKQFCEHFLQPTTTANHTSVDVPNIKERESRLAKLSAEAKSVELELQNIAKASMLTGLLK